MNLSPKIIFLIIAAIITTVVVYFYSKKKSRRTHVASIDNAEGKQQIYIGNLDYNIRKNTLTETFKPFGKIREVRIIQNSKTGRSKGFAFISFETSQQAQKALKMHGRSLNGRSLVVRIAKKRDE